MNPRLSSINRNEVLIYLGHKGSTVPAEIEASISRCESILLQNASPRIVWRSFPILPDGSLSGIDFHLEGSDVRNLLSGCSAVIFMAATLGAETDTLIRHYQVRNMTEAVILDACGSAAIENVCDNFCRDMEEQLSPQFLTDRFSPGYGDLPFSQQKDFCNLLEVGRRIGVSLSPSGLMIPQKTVTALMGVSPVKKKKRSRGCAYCTLFTTCTYRKDGNSCENH